MTTRRWVWIGIATAATVAATVAAVVRWRRDGLETVSWLAGIAAFLAAVVLPVVARPTGPSVPPDRSRRQSATRVRAGQLAMPPAGGSGTGLGAVVLLGALGVTAVVAVTLGVVLTLAG